MQSYPSPSHHTVRYPEPVFVNLLRSPGIDFQPGGTVRQPYLSYRSARLHRLAESIPQNRLLGFINVYKYGLRDGSWGGGEGGHSYITFDPSLTVS